VRSGLDCGFLYNGHLSVSVFVCVRVRLMQQILETVIDSASPTALQNPEIF